MQCQRHSPLRGRREKIWDHAAGFIIVEEAGGRVTDAAGRRLDFTQGRHLELDRCARGPQRGEGRTGTCADHCGCPQSSCGVVVRRAGASSPRRPTSTPRCCGPSPPCRASSRRRIRSSSSSSSSSRRNPAASIPPPCNDAGGLRRRDHWLASGASWNKGGQLQGAIAPRGKVSPTCTEAWLQQVGCAQRERFRAEPQHACRLPRDEGV